MSSVNKTVKLVDFWPDNPETTLNTFKKYFPALRDYSLTSGVPDLYLCSVFGHEQYSVSGGKKIVFIGENRRRWTQFEIKDCPNSILFLTCNKSEDYPELLKEKICYTPFFSLYYNDLQFRVPRTVQSVNNKKSKFCCIVVSNNSSDYGSKLRYNFFLELSKYKRVDSAGPAFNNTGYLAPKDPKDYMAWIGQYKFMICFENSYGKGYVTEKLFNGLCGGTVPIYWGDTVAANELFNGGSFLCLNSGTVDATIDTIKYLDNNDLDYNKMWIQDPFLESTESMFSDIRKRLEDALV